MTKRNFPYDVFEQAQDVQTGWTKFDQELSFGQLNMGALVMDINRLRGIEQNIASLEKDLTDLRNQRDTVGFATWDKVKRVRAGVKAHFGDDSSQYELVGGTRLSERKTPRRTQAPVQ